MFDDIREGKNEVFYEIIRANGAKERGKTFNLRTQDGATWQANQMAGSPTTIIRHISLTSNGDTPASTDSNLAGELAADGLSRKTATLTYTTGASRYTLSATWNYTGGSTLSVKKAAISSAITDHTPDWSADTMFVETLLSPEAVLTSGDTLSLTWGIVF